MIVQEHFDVNGVDFVRTYSDSGRFVVRNGTEYAEACDPADFGRRYTEGDLIDNSSISALADKAEAYDILMGGVS